ncbi:hypothetical protein QBZ16_003495 [Prototheca wickerhamii]|uniref:Uncharacterized protein n=1 Tax=Prototheca wickerhamii TaxID=3111 RepID=A0AAD9IK30_PROWI|nr:hypothetical protein QBZ16_003495 [Prototheca wickerhamii]
MGAEDDAWMLAASGDQTISLWDTGVARQLGVFAGHTGSVKTVDPHPVSASVFASGARDGQLAVWDARAGRSAGASTSYGGSTAAPWPLAAWMGWSSSGTCAAAGAAGAGAGGAGAVAALEAAAWSIDFLEASALPGALCVPQQKQHGITSLALHPDGTRLLVSLTGGHLLLYDTARPRAPTDWLSGHLCHSFYVKAAFSPDGACVASGSSDNSVCVWDLDARRHREAALGHARGAPCQPARLAGHEGEVTAVAWCPSDPDCLVSAGDDAALRVWRRGPPRQAPERPADVRPLDEEGDRAVIAALGTPLRAGPGPAPFTNASTPASAMQTPRRPRAVLAAYFSAPRPQALTAGQLRPEGPPGPASENAPTTPLHAAHSNNEAPRSPFSQGRLPFPPLATTTGRKRARQASITSFFQSPMRPFADLTNQLDEAGCPPPNPRRVTFG